MATGFDKAVWNGTQPIAPPQPEPTIEVGSVVWEKAPDDADYEPRGGMVVAIGANEDGETVVTLLRSKMQTGKFSVFTTELLASDLNTALIEPASKGRLHRAARQICRALGERQGGYVVGRDRWFLELALTLTQEAVGEA